MHVNKNFKVFLFTSGKLKGSSTSLSPTTLLQSVEDTKIKKKVGIILILCLRVIPPIPEITDGIEDIDKDTQHRGVDGLSCDSLPPTYQ